MAEHVIRLPDVGEGIAEAELVEWHVKVGDLVRADTTLAAVMTDKATVEIPSPVDGEIIWLGAEIGDKVAVGSDLVRLKIPGERDAASAAQPQPRSAAAEAAKPAHAAKPRAADSQDRGPSPVMPPTPAPRPAQLAEPRPAPRATARAGAVRPVASPAVRLRAREAGIDLRQVPGSAPAGRITHEDLDAFAARDPRLMRSQALQPKSAVEDVKVIGLRRRIAEQMAVAHARIPHITYVEEVDVTALEELRETLNRRKRKDQPRLTLLPFLMRAMVSAIAKQPRLNALFDDEAGVIHQHAGVHIGVAAQTSAGLVVPVVRHVESLDLWDCAAEVARLAEAARTGTATREELSGSTITITSLGAMGGVVSTPIINHPEVAIVGVNKIMMRPVWDGSGFIPRKMMNLSSSFDHRVIDGWDAATFVQYIKALMETPALIFVND
ncbi:MAG TPA: dihydrolipoamide acetyltransferase family protein [Acetobacteraceae bacterium]|jgi:2-oxoisovalerate dehydrogenase E2 component (dihydrolipoyl transacylase)|nr:dihydrolipoamide acetyltransferase family protein [Acetobacteraceae bacterium]